MARDSKIRLRGTPGRSAAVPILLVLTAALWHPARSFGDDRVHVLGSFETDDNLARWTAPATPRGDCRLARLERVTDHASAGKASFNMR